jgi:hypothetical protein
MENDPLWGYRVELIVGITHSLVVERYRLLNIPNLATLQIVSKAVEYL